MNRDEKILVTEEFVRQNLKDYDSGHDWWHIERVRRLALYINIQEDAANPFIVEITALLHDSADSKFSDGNSEKAYGLICEFMKSCGMSEISDQVVTVIKHVSFSSMNKSDVSDDPLLWVIQDADRLDAIGAIGVARAFNYGGFRNNPIYVPPDISGTLESSTIRHFYDKLLKLKDLMNTSTGRRIAADRHLYLEKYLEQFYNEWEFLKSHGQ
jgi:uncharacterized protein